VPLASVPPTMSDHQPVIYGSLDINAWWGSIFHAIINKFSQQSIHTDYYAPDRREGAIRVAFVRPSVCPSICLSVEHIANNSITQKPSVPKFGMKVPHLRCDLHTSFKVKRSNVRFTDGRGHTVLPEPSGHTTCYFLFKRLTLL